MLDVMDGSKRNIEYVEINDVVKCCPIQRIIWSSTTHKIKWILVKMYMRYWKKFFLNSFNREVNENNIAKKENAVIFTITAQIKPWKGLSTNAPPVGVSVKYNCANCKTLAPKMMKKNIKELLKTSLLNFK